MVEGILEVLLVHAQGIRHTNLIGKPSYYALLQCGSEVWKSKITKGHHHEAIWNQECEFKFPLSEWKNLTHLKISIMDEEFFTDGGFVGQAIIFLGGIVQEGNDRGFLELHPSPYNIVLEDTTYKGEIKIGLKFRVNNEGCKEIREERSVMKVMGTRPQVCNSLWRLLRLSWWRLLFPYDQC